MLFKSSPKWKLFYLKLLASSVVRQSPVTEPKFRSQWLWSFSVTECYWPIPNIFEIFLSVRGGVKRGPIFYWISWRFTQIWVESKKKNFFESPQDFIYRRTLLNVFLSIFMTTVNRRPRLFSRKKAWPISVKFRWSITTLLAGNNWEEEEKWTSSFWQPLHCYNMMVNDSKILEVQWHFLKDST